MDKILSKLKRESVLCEIYTDRNFDAFNVGYLVYLDKDWYGISDYKPNGDWDGYLFRQTDTVSRIAVKSKYLNKMQSLIKKEHLVYPFELTDEGIVICALNYVKKTSKVIKIELFNDCDLTLIGLIKDISDEYLTVEELDTYGEMTTISVIKISDISYLEFDAEEELLIQKFVEKR